MVLDVPSWFKCCYILQASLGCTFLAASFVLESTFWGHQNDDDNLVDRASASPATAVVQSKLHQSNLRHFPVSLLPQYHSVKKKLITGDHTLKPMKYYSGSWCGFVWVWSKHDSLANTAPSVVSWKHALLGGLLYKVLDCSCFQLRATDCLTCHPRLSNIVL